MKRLLAGAAGFIVAFAVASCIDFDESQRQYCQSLGCHARAQICQDGPQITQTVPDKNATGVLATARVVVTFSQPLTCGDAGMYLVQYTSGEPPVPGTFSCSGNTAVFTPSAPLAAMRVHKVYVNDCQMYNDAGVSALDASWTFTTQ